MTSGANSSTSAGGQTATDPTTITQSGPAGTPPAPPARPAVGQQQPRRRLRPGRRADTLHAEGVGRGRAGPTAGMVVVTDALPAGLTPVELTGEGWTCSLAAPTLPRGGLAADTCTTLPAPADLLPVRLAPAGRLVPADHPRGRGGQQRAAVGDQHRLGVRRRRDPATGTDPTKVKQLPRWWSPARTPPAASRTPRSRRATARQQDVYTVTVANDGYRADQRHGDVRRRPARWRAGAVDRRSRLVLRCRVAQPAAPTRGSPSRLASRIRSP